MKSADIKEESRLLQFRAQDRYSYMLSVIIECINEKIDKIGGDSKTTVSDVLKMAIESLALGKSCINILGKDFDVKELVKEKLMMYFDDFDIYKYEIVIEKICLIIIKEDMEAVIHELEDIDIMPTLDNNGVSEIQSLEITITSTDRIIKKIQYMCYVENTYPKADSKQIVDLIKQLKRLKIYKNIDFDELKSLESFSRIEKNIMVQDDFSYFFALKLFDHYRYSEIITELRNMISTYLNKIFSGISNIENELPKDDIIKIDKEMIENTIKNLEKSMEIDVLPPYEDYLCEFDILPGDPGYEGSISEKLYYKYIE